MSIEKLSQDEIIRELNTLTGWNIIDNKLHKEYVFADFVQAFGFMTQVALLAERSNHHPEWFNVYKTVRVDLTTHEASGISTRDFALAREMDALLDH